MPADDDVDFARWLVLVATEKIDAAAVGGDGVLGSPVAETNWRHRQFGGRTEFWASIASPLHGHALQAALGIDEEQLLPIASPDRLGTAIGGDQTRFNDPATARTDTSDRPDSSDV